MFNCVRWDEWANVFTFFSDELSQHRTVRSSRYNHIDRECERMSRRVCSCIGNVNMLWGSRRHQMPHSEHEMLRGERLVRWDRCLNNPSNLLQCLTFEQPLIQQRQPTDPQHDIRRRLLVQRRSMWDTRRVTSTAIKRTTSARVFALPTESPTIARHIWRRRTCAKVARNAALRKIHTWTILTCECWLDRKTRARRQWSLKRRQRK